jgi:hypothetical protein
MKSLVSMVSEVSSLLCRHEWIRDRGPKHELLMRCMKCGKTSRHGWARIAQENFRYTPFLDVGSASVSQRLPLQPSAPVEDRRAA